MKLAWFWRALTAIALVLLVAWFVRNTEWIEVDETAPAHGAAVDDKFYALRALMAATDSRFEVRTTLEPLPPPSATLVLDSLSWNIFPERDAALKAWVEAGGHLVFSGSPMSDETLRWVPLDFHRWSNAHARVCAAEAAASAPHPGADDEEDEDEDDKGRRPGSCAASSWTPGPAPSAPGPRSPDAAASAAWVAKKGAPHCALLHEAVDHCGARLGRVEHLGVELCAEHRAGAVHLLTEGAVELGARDLVAIHAGDVGTLVEIVAEALNPDHAQTGHDDQDQ